VLLRRVLDRAQTVAPPTLSPPRPQKRVAESSSQHAIPPSTRRKHSQESLVTLDVSGTFCKVNRDLLFALGPSSFFQAELEDFGSTHEPISLLGCHKDAFEELQHALVAAQENLESGIQAIVLGLDGPCGSAVGELLDFIGLSWLQGERYKLPPGLSASSNVLRIENVKTRFEGGVLRQLADRNLLLRDFEGRKPWEHGMVHFARESKWAKSLSEEQAVTQVLSLASKPWSPRDSAMGPKGCFQPNVLRDGDRLVFDVGPGRFLVLEALVLCISAMEQEEHITVRVRAGNIKGAAAASLPDVRAPVRYRDHYFSADPAGGWTMPPQTCSVVVITSPDTCAPLVGRMFVAACSIANKSTLAIYHAELFGRLLKAPADFAAAHGAAKPFAIDVTSRIHCVQSQDPCYPEELAFLRSFGLLDPASEQELDELDWHDYNNGDDY